MKKFVRLTLILFICASGKIQAQTEFYGKNKLESLSQTNPGTTRNSIFLPDGIRIITGNESQVDYMLSDHLGSTRVLINNVNQTILACDYDPYGKASAGIALSEQNNIKYTGAYSYDLMSGLYSSPSRKYDPQTRRFLSADPQRQTPAVYAYVAGNPITYKDPDGRIIIISWEGPENLHWLFREPKEMRYQYDPHRNKMPDLDPSLSSFKDYMVAILDNIHDAMNINLGTASRPQKENILERMANDNEIKLFIQNKTSFSDKNISAFKVSNGRAFIEYSPFQGMSSATYKNRGELLQQIQSGLVPGYKNQEAVLQALRENRFDLNATRVNNSPRGIMVHELVHAHGYFYDRESYARRIQQTYEIDHPFPNAEEERAVLQANKVYARIGENRQKRYRGINILPVASPFSSEEHIGPAMQIGGEGLGFWGSLRYRVFDYFYETMGFRYF